MTDIVGVFKGYTDSLGWYFNYGNKANQNLIQSDMIEGAIYFLLDPVTRNVVLSNFGGDGLTEFNGSFMLVVKSDLDNTYDDTTEDEKFDLRTIKDGGIVGTNICEVTTKVGKYQLNIKPLLDELETFKRVLICDNYTIDTWSVVDVIDALDMNFDGVIVTYKVSKL